MTRSDEISRASLACLGFLQDPAGSGNDPFGGGDRPALRLEGFLAGVVNRALSDLVIRCTKARATRDDLHVRRGLQACPLCRPDAQKP